MLVKMYYPSTQTYNNEIINYIDQNFDTLEEKKEVLEYLKFTVDDDGTVRW
jgi:hypothetical protein